VQQVVGLKRYPFLSGGLLHEQKGLVVVVEAEGQGDVHAQLTAEVAVTNGLGDATAGAVVELGDDPAAGAFWRFMATEEVARKSLGFVHCSPSSRRRPDPGPAMF